MKRERGLYLRGAVCVVVGLAAACSSSTEATVDGGDAATDAPMMVDAAPGDAGETDAGPADAGVDSGPEDAGTDAGPMDAGPPPCGLPIAGELTLPSDMATGRLRGESENTTTTCTTDRGTQGPEAVYRLHVSERTGVVIGAESGSDTVLAIREVCDDPTTELACNNDASFDTDDAELRAVLEPGHYFVLLDVYAFGVGGDYTLTLESFEPAPNATCASATQVMDGTMLTDQDPTAAGESTVECSGAPPTQGRLLYYRADVPAMHKLVVEAMASEPRPLEIRILPDCGSSMCLAGSDFGFDSVTAEHANDTASSDSVIIVVGSGEDPMRTEPVPFDLSVQMEALADNAACSMAQTVMPDTTVSGDTRLGGDAEMPCSMDATGLLYYSVSVPDGEQLEVEVMPTGAPLSPVIGVLDGCGSGATCLGSTEGFPPVVRYVNTSGSAQSVIVAVGQRPFEPGGTFDATFTLEVVPDNAACTSPVSVSDGSMVSGDTSLGGATLGTCSGDVYGPLYYSATVPAGETLQAGLVSSDPSLDARLALLDGCPGSGGTCLAESGFDESLTYRNDTGSSRSVILAVGARRAGRHGDFDMAVSIGPPPANVACSMATAVMDATSLVLESNAAATDMSSACSRPLSNVLYYEASVPAGERLTASASSTGFPMGIDVLDGCSAPMCLADSGGTPQPTVSYTNSSGSSQTVILAAGSLFGDTGSFDLDASIGPPPYSVTTAAQSCDDMSGATVLPLGGDDSATNVNPLPFTVPFFGDSMTHFSVTTNGFMQLYPSSTGPPSTNFANRPIPDPNRPNGYVAPLWDDLEAPPGSEIRTATFGTSPSRHFTVEWSGYRFLGDAGSQLRFQAQLYEDGVVETHYCELIPGFDADRATGSRATVGIEGPNGLDGVMHSYNMPMAISTADAIRYTP